MQLLYYSIPISLSSAYINFMAPSTEDKVIRVSIGGRGHVKFERCEYDDREKGY